MSDRMDRLGRLLEEAGSLAAEDRLAFVEERCAVDPELARELLQLLAARDRPSVLDSVEQRDRSSGGELSPGARLGPYEILDEIGRGGMGTVYRARRADGQFELDVAVKVLRRDVGRPDLRSRFLAERRILAGLSHSNIARLLDGGLTASDRPYFVMEYVDGPPVDAYCDRERLSLTDRLWVFLTICDAVEHAHRNLIVHRDLKPGNVLVGSDGLVRLVDFGIAKLLDEEGSETSGETTRFGARMLTPDYASPEQLRGERVTTASDVYQLGLVLRKLLWGDRTGETPSPTVATARRTTPERLRRALAGDVEMIVAKALRPEPDRRYGSAGALADDVRRHLAGRPVRARPDTWRYRTGKFVRRNPLPLSMAGALMIALVGFSVGIARQAQRTAVERDRAEAVADYVAELLGNANAREVSDDSVLVRDVLDRGAARVRDELPDQPEVRATLMFVMADAYEGLGLHERARALHEEALEIRRAELDRAHPDVGASLRALALAEVQLEQFAASAALLEEATAHARQFLEPGSVELATALGDLGHGWQIHTEYDRAEQLMKEAVSLLRRPGAPVDELADDLSNLGYLRQARNDLDSAEVLLSEVVAIRAGTRAADDVVLAEARTALAQLLVDLERYDDAERFFMQALGVLESSLPSGHPRVAGLNGGLASLLRRRGDDEGAVRLWREAIESLDRTSGERDLGATNYRNNMALALRDLGRLEEAEHEFRVALETYRAYFGEDHLFVGVALGNLATVLFRGGQWQEAVAALERATDIKAVEQPGHWGTARSVVDLGIARSGAGDLDGALADLREGVDLSRKAHPVGHDSVLRAENALGQTLIRLDELDEAEALLLGTLEQAADRAANDPYRAFTTNLLVELYTALGKPEQAELYRPGG